jgi:hypothetical protein
MKGNPVKTNETRLLLALAAASIAASCYPTAALAQGGGGTRGRTGFGEILDVDGTPILRDLVDKAICVDHKTGVEMIAETHGAFDEIMGKVAGLDWYFAGDVRRELESLRFCIVDAPIGSAEDRKGPEANEPGCVLPSVHGRELKNIAYRHNERVVLVKSLFYGGDGNKPLGDVMRGLLMIHETFHSYLDQSQPWCERRQELWSMVDDVANIENGVPYNRESFHKAMEGNDFQFPTKVAFLDPFQTQLEFLLASETDRKAKLLAAKSVDSVSELPVERIREALAPWDREYLERNRPGEIAARTIEDILERGSLDDFTKLVAKPGTGERNPVLIGLAHWDELAIERQSALLQSPDYAKMLIRAYDGLTEKHAPVYLEAYRIRASLELQAKLGAVPVENQPILDMDVYSTDGLPEEARAVIRQIVLLVNNGSEAAIDTLKSDITESPDFYSAFGWQSQLAKIDLIIVGPAHAINREGGYARDRMIKLRDRFLDRFFRELEQRLGPDLYKTIQPMFHMDRF